MTSFTIALAVEILVGALLAVTIGFCFVLNRRLTRLKSDEQALKATISELITATEIAERAIQGLKVTVRECDATLGERLRTAERFVGEIDREIEAGQAVLERVARITEAARQAKAPEPAAPPTPEPTLPRAVEPIHAGAAATLAAASAFAQRRQARAA